MELTKEKAKVLYPESPDWFRAELEKEFGKKTFEKEEYEKLKTFDDCCRECGTTEEEFNKKHLPLNLNPDVLNMERLGIINRAINGPGWKPDYTNRSQFKWFPVFEFSSSGFGFSLSRYYCDYTITFVGSRLCTDTAEKALWALEKCREHYEKWLL